jgi:hypothetical protein
MDAKGTKMKTVTFDETLWQLVPKEPTEEMIDGGCQIALTEETPEQYCVYIKKIISEALAAAPEAPEQQVIEPEVVQGVPVSEISGAVARGWCTGGNGHKEMDWQLAQAITEEIRLLLTAAPKPPADIETLRTRLANPVVPLSDEQIVSLLHPNGTTARLIEFARAIEAHHGIGKQDG